MTSFVYLRTLYRIYSKIISMVVTTFVSLFQPARRRAERRQRPQRHTVAAADVRITSEATAAASEQPQRAEERPQNQISRWYSTNKLNNFRILDSNSDLTSTPSTPTPFYEEVQVLPKLSLLPSAASVVRALSPLLTPAWMAANNMAQKAAKNAVKNEEVEIPEQQPPPQPMEAKDVPILSQVRFL